MKDTTEQSTKLTQPKVHKTTTSDLNWPLPPPLKEVDVKKLYKEHPQKTWEKKTLTESKKEGFSLENGYLYKVTNGIHALYIPNSQARHRIIEYSHHLDAKLSRHRRVKATVNNISTTAYWPSLRKDVVMHIKTCPGCAKKPKTVSTKANPSPPHIKKSLAKQTQPTQPSIIFIEPSTSDKMMFSHSYQNPIYEDEPIWYNSNETPQVSLPSSQPTFDDSPPSSPQFAHITEEPDDETMEISIPEDSDMIDEV
ncbi:hypothetical protein JVU11DRAFT_12043 [Chiua virens]|nr:hypothetical protein JVU11DRAFT_12043 [Chiua virens]